MSKVKRKTFWDNESYFKFYNKMKDIINIISIKCLSDKIKIEYEEVKKWDTIREIPY